MKSVPVITMDGESCSGKGTIAEKLAEKLGWYFLDSGALYRTIGWLLVQQHQTLSDVDAIIKLIHTSSIEINPDPTNRIVSVFCNGHDISRAIRTNECAGAASKIAAIPEVRQALMEKQRVFRRQPGLVADGRDMGTVIFPDALVKFYFTADVSIRAKRRYNQLKALGINDSLASIEAEVKKRDARDKHREFAPMKPAPDAIVVDTTSASVEATIETVWQGVERVLYNDIK